MKEVIYIEYTSKNNQDGFELNLEESDRFIKDSIADTMDIYGVTRSVGLIYATLYLNDEPMTLDELRDELGMSKGSMSIGVRRLIEDKLIHRVYRKGHRKSLYQAELDFFQFFSSFFTRRWQREMSVNIQGVRKARPGYQALIDNPDTPEHVRSEAQYKLNKITKSVQYYDFLELLVAKCQTGELFNMILEEKKK